MARGTPRVPADVNARYAKSEQKRGGRGCARRRSAVASTAANPGPAL